MPTLAERANQLIQQAEQAGKCADQVKNLRRKLEDLKAESGLSAGQVLGACVAGAGVVAAFFSFGAGAGLVISGLTVLSVTTDAKQTRIKKAIREVQRAIEDLEECLG